MVLGITACGAGNVSAEQENKEQTEIESILNISNKMKLHGVMTVSQIPGQCL